MTIRNACSNLLDTILQLLPTVNAIIFESVPDCCDNSWAVYKEMLAQTVDKRYQLIWICKDYDRTKACLKYSKVKLLRADSLMARFFISCGKVLISSNSILTPRKDKQFGIYLGHGTAIKNVGSFIKIPDSMNYCLAASDFTASLRAAEYKISPDRVIALGFPRNDVFVSQQLDLHPILNRDYKKVVVWYPTYRQHKSGIKTKSSHALPILWDERKAFEINAYAQQLGILLVIKPHFAQDITYITKLNLTNIFFISDEFFFAHGISSYQFVGSCDALVSDYSSIIFDYTLCDKPIGVIWEDYEEYKVDPGFAIDMDSMMRGTQKIFNVDDLFKFLSDVAKNNDDLKNERRRIRDLTNYSTDGKNAYRVVNFIRKMAKLDD